MHFSRSLNSHSKSRPSKFIVLGACWDRHIFFVIWQPNPTRWMRLSQLPLTPNPCPSVCISLSICDASTSSLSPFVCQNPPQPRQPLCSMAVSPSIWHNLPNINLMGYYLSVLMLPISPEYVQNCMSSAAKQCCLLAACWIPNICAAPFSKRIICYSV